MLQHKITNRSRTAVLTPGRIGTLLPAASPGASGVFRDYREEAPLFLLTVTALGNVSATDRPYPLKDNDITAFLKYR